MLYTRLHDAIINPRSSLSSAFKQRRDACSLPRGDPDHLQGDHARLPPLLFIFFLFFFSSDLAILVLVEISLGILLTGGEIAGINTIMAVEDERTNEIFN